MQRLATVLGVDIDLPAPVEVEADDAREAVRERTVALFRELREPLGRYLASLGVKPSEIDELIQESFLRLHRHLSSGADGANLQGWVFRVAQNLVRDRRRGWHGRNVGQLEDYPEAALASTAEATPEERVLHLEKMNRLRAAMRALPPQQQRCLQLRAQGLRYREIAQALGVSVTTVADLIREALSHLGRNT